MALDKIKDFDPDYRSHFDDHDVKGLDLYAANEKIGSVDDVLVDDEGQFRYLIINTGLWILGKKVLFPIGCARIDYNDRRVYADSLDKAQVEALPEFTDDMTVDYDHEEQVRGIYRSSKPNIQQDAPAAYGVGYAGTDSAPDKTLHQYLTLKQVMQAMIVIPILTIKNPIFTVSMSRIILV